MRCGQCRFWAKIVPDASNVMGECRRFPPTLGGEHIFYTVNGFNRFPRTMFASWCGEFKMTSVAPKDRP